MSGCRTYRHTFLKAALGGALLGVGGLVYAREVEPYRVAVERVTLTLPRLALPFDGYRIVHISDLHLDGWMTPERLEQIVDLINQEAPDLVAITGDFATYSPLAGALARHVPPLAAPLRRLAVPAFAVLGNHDHKPDANLARRALAAVGAARKARSPAETVRRVLAASGVVELRNRVQTVRRGGAALHLCGVDSALRGMDRLGSVLDGLPAEGAAVLLAHEPDFADRSAATGRFELQLSGHSHGGQVKVPLLGAPLLPPLGRKYPGGLYGVKGMHLYTNRGLGSHPRLRLNCRPEITLLTLRTPRGDDYPAGLYAQNTAWPARARGTSA